jgi:hypothetical protein
VAAKDVVISGAGRGVESKGIGRLSMSGGFSPGDYATMAMAEGKSRGSRWPKTELNVVDEEGLDEDVQRRHRRAR